MIDVTELVGTVFSGLSALVIGDVEDAGDMIVVRAVTRDRAVACPGCGTQTARVHGYQERTAADVPADGRRVVLKVRTRRMRCPAPDCRRQTFREQVPGVLERYQRRTAQVSPVVRELAGRASARLLPALGIRASRHTMLRALLRIPLPALAVPRVLGIDDFALRRGSVYATVFIDAQAGRRVDVVQGRTAGVTEKWLKDHPGVEVVCRDGPGAYGEAVRQALPGAVQAGDRWHRLWRRGDRFCAACGAPLRGCPSCGQPVSPGDRFCRACGHQLSDPATASLVTPSGALLAEQRTRTLNDRFDTVAGQLGSDKPPAVRLAGVYAMASLADDWPDHRQMCVEVLCGCLRMPYEPEPGDDAPVEKRLAWQAGREVRHSVIRVITAHLNGTAPDSWCGLDFDFSGGTVDFFGAKFCGARVNFFLANFSGAKVDFAGAEISGGTVNFAYAGFSGETVNFTSASFSGGARGPDRRGQFFAALAALGGQAADVGEELGGQLAASPGNRIRWPDLLEEAGGLGRGDLRRVTAGDQVAKHCM